MAGQKKGGIIRAVRRGLAGLVGARLREDIFSGGQILFEPDDPEGNVYRSIRNGRARRTIPAFLMDEQSRQSYKLLVENQFINRIANLKADFIVGGGITPRSDDEQVAAAVDDFWNDQINDLRHKQHQYALEFRLYGEMLFEKVLNRETGGVRLNPRDPLEIGGVLPHPKYNLIPMTLVMRQDYASHVKARIINTLPHEMQSVQHAAQVYYFRANQLTGSLRGVSDYYATLEFADALDAGTWSMLERMNQLITYIWHMKVPNMDEESKKAWQATLENARPSTGLITTPEVELTAVSPDLKNADFTTGADFIKEQIAMAAGIPVNWLGKGGDANVGEAASMDMPSLKSLTRAQGEYLRVLEQMIDDYLHERVRHGTLPGIDDKGIAPWDNYTLQVAPVSRKEMGQVAAVAAQLSSSLSLAISENWVTGKEAAMVFRSIVSELVELADALPDELAGELEQGISREELSAFRGLADRLNGEGSITVSSNPNGSVERGAGSRIDALSNGAA